MGEGIGTTNEQVRAGDADEEEATGRPQGADAAAATGARRPGEEHDDSEGQEERDTHQEASGAREVSPG